jgi:hypothetical protein
MTTLYRVLTGFRVGAAQRWLKPDDKVELLPCEAQFPLGRGWLVEESVHQSLINQSTVSAKKVSVTKKESN